MWLGRRLEIGRRGADVLTRKRRALVRLEQTLSAEVSLAEAAWEDAARDAFSWASRAAVVSGERRLALASLYAPTPLRAHVAWSSALGLVYPTSCELAPEPSTGLGAVGGSSATLIASQAHRTALELGARYAVFRTAHERVVAELAQVAVRVRAIERRWIPAHEAALAHLEVVLDETEREDAVRFRRVRRRSG